MVNIASSEDEDDDVDVSIAPLRYSVTRRRGDHSIVTPPRDVPPHNQRMMMEQRASSVVAYFVAGLTKTEAASTADDHNVGSTKTDAFGQRAPAAAAAVASTTDDHALISNETSEMDGFRHRGASVALPVAAAAAAASRATQTTTAQQTLLIPIAPKPAFATKTNNTRASSASAFPVNATTAAGMNLKARDGGDGGFDLATPQAQLLGPQIRAVESIHSQQDVRSHPSPITWRVEVLTCMALQMQKVQEWKFAKKIYP